MSGQSQVQTLVTTTNEKNPSIRLLTYDDLFQGVDFQVTEVGVITGRQGVLWGEKGRDTVDTVLKGSEDLGDNK